MKVNLLGGVQGLWLVTGAAGFIGSNLVETLLLAGQQVRAIDNFATGHRQNLDAVLRSLPTAYAANFTLVEGDITDSAVCMQAMKGVRRVVHLAALGSVPRSLDNPINTNAANITGFLNILDAARREAVDGFVYASSSAVYGDEPNLPKEEGRVGKPLSPYAVTKCVNELYAENFARVYGFKAIGLRYFNVFGARQDPNGAYAAVIPRWVDAIIKNQPITINGDGETSRDFCYIDNVVQANIRSALAPDSARGKVYNIAAGGRTTLNQLFGLIRDGLAQLHVAYSLEPHYGGFRPGDVRHSHADIALARDRLGYAPTHDILAGLTATLPWYLANQTHFSKEA